MSYGECVNLKKETKMIKKITLALAALTLAACAETAHYNTGACGYRATGCGAPITVKTGSEVIDHYQTYAPVTTYVPSGTYSTRRVVSAPRATCNRCGY